MNYLIIYNDTKVLSCGPFIATNALALPPTGINVLINDLQTAKMMLDAAGIDYGDIPELMA